MTKTKNTKSQNWTKDDCDVLIAMWANTRTEIIADQLARTTPAIRAKIRKLGLKRPDKFSPLTMPRHWHCLGAYSVDDKGYLNVKVANGNHRANWRPVHRLIWEQANGPIPKGHRVAFKAGRFSNVPELITLDAIELITDQEMGCRNCPSTLNPELAELCQLKSCIARQINRIQKDAV